MRFKFWITGVCIACFSCVYNKKEAVTPSSNNNVNDGNPTIPVSFKNDISPIIQNNCISCHGIYGDLGSYTNLNKYTTSTSGKASELEGRIKGMEGWNKMPQGGSLSQLEINKITQWINEGAKDN